MKKLKVGDHVKILKYWDGTGTIEEIYPADRGYGVRMQTGTFRKNLGGFELDEVELIETSKNTTMEVISIKRSQQPGPLKIYGRILGETGKVYNFAYYRGIHREWQCTCESFMLSEKGKNGNCKHLRHVRKTYGRYGATVKPTTTLNSTNVPLTDSQS